MNFETLEPRQLLATIVAADGGGSWQTGSTWVGGVVPGAGDRVLIGQHTTTEAPILVTLNSTAPHVAKQIVVNGGTLRVLEGGVGSAQRSLSAEWIHVNSGGTFRVGLAGNRYDNNSFELTLTGTNTSADWTVETADGGTMSINNNDGFLMTASGGRLVFYGDEKLSFTKLATTALAGSNTITVENVIERNFDGTTSTGSDGTLDWEVDDQIVIASSSYDYADEEVRTIDAISVNGNQTTLTLNAALAHRHYGAIESYKNGELSIDLRAEVALLNRSITIQGTQDTDNSFGDRANYGNGSGENVGIGAHTMIMPGSGQITIDSVRFDKMGQTGRLGRYPVHWHVAGDRTGDVMRNSSVTNSNNRGVTIHGTQNVRLEDNVLHDIHGHGFFMEDAAETGNEFFSNIVLGIHKVGGKFNGSDANDPFIVPGITRGADGKVNGEAARNGNGESSHDTGQNFQPRFLHSAAYWITNPDNTWVGNVSAGSEGTGFWFALPDRVLGLSEDTGLYNNLDPNNTNLDQFDHNTTHSSPVGLTFDRGGDLLPGSSNSYSPSQLMQVNHLTGYKHDGTAVYHRGPVGKFNESRFADNENSSFNTFRQEEHNVLFVGHSIGNADLTKTVGGFRLYDGPGRIVNSHFAGFAADNAFTFRVEGGANKHSHTTAQGITFEADGTADHLSIEFKEKDTIVTDNSPVFVSGRPDGFSGLVLDVDGSLTGHAGGKAGDVLTPKLDFYRDSTDIAPAGWDAYISDDRFGQLKIGTINDVGMVPDYRIENGDGHAIVANRTNLDFIQRQYAKVNAGDYTVNFLDAIPSTGFEVYLDVQAGGIAGDSTVLRFVGVAEDFKPTTGSSVNSLTALRVANQTSYLRDYAGDLWMKVFESNNTIQVGPTNDPLPPAPQSPYVAQTVTDGTRVLVEEFDIGGEGVAYHDTTPANTGGTARLDEAVDIGGTNLVLTNIADGEWLEFTRDVNPGMYNVVFRVLANSANPRSIRLLVAENNTTDVYTDLGSVDANEVTSGYENFVLQNVDLTSFGGQDRVFRLEFIGGQHNLNWFEFTAVAETSTVVNRGVAYGGTTASYGQDILDTSKSAYLHLPGTSSSNTNYTNYTKGLNRVVVDLANSQPATLTTADFQFRVGNTNDPSGWTLLDGSSTIPLPTIINGTRNSGTGVQRFTLAWEGSQTIKNQWLQVTVKAGGNTSLASDDVFYFGNQIADVFGSTSAGNKVAVNAFDTILIRANQSSAPNSAGLNHVYDVDRNGAVNAIDTILARANQASGGGLLMLSAPEPTGAAVSFSAFAFVVETAAVDPADVLIAVPPAETIRLVPASLPWPPTIRSESTTTTVSGNPIESASFTWVPAVGNVTVPTPEMDDAADQRLIRQNLQRRFSVAKLDRLYAETDLPNDQNASNRDFPNTESRHDAHEIDTIFAEPLNLILELISRFS